MLKQHGSLIRDPGTSRCIILWDNGEESQLDTGDRFDFLYRGQWITGTLEYWENEWRFVGVPAVMFEGAEVRM